MNKCDLKRDNDNLEAVDIFLRDSLTRNEPSTQLYDSDEHRIPK